MRLPSPAARALATARTASATSASLGGTASLRSGFMVPLYAKRGIRSTVRISLRKSKACGAPQAKSDFSLRAVVPLNLLFMGRTYGEHPSSTSWYK
eukprot:scaffold13124_cov70-Phaeocystis_antarctica.AAC.2